MYVYFRFEDLITKPYWMVDKLFEFLDLGKPPQFIDEFLVRRTGETRSNHNTNEKQHSSFYWFHDNDNNNENWLKSIEQTCSKPMEILGYANYSSDINENSHYLAKTAYEVWPYNFDLKNNQ